MRKSITINLEDGGTQKKFKVTQMSAFAQQDFILRLGLALADSEGAKINFRTRSVDADAIIAAFFDKIKTRGFSVFAGLKIEKIRELTTELLTCCVRVVDAYEQPITEDNIDEVKTLTRLQVEAFKLNFFPAITESGSESLSNTIEITRKKRG